MPREVWVDSAKQGELIGDELKRQHGDERGEWPVAGNHYRIAVEPLCQPGVVRDDSNLGIARLDLLADGAHRGRVFIIQDDEHDGRGLLAHIGNECKWTMLQRTAGIALTEASVRGSDDGRRSSDEQMTKRASACMYEHSLILRAPSYAIGSPYPWRAQKRTLILFSRTWEARSEAAALPCPR